MSRVAFRIPMSNFIGRPVRLSVFPLIQPHMLPMHQNKTQNDSQVWNELLPKMVMAKIKKYDLI